MNKKNKRILIGVIIAFVVFVGSSNLHIARPIIPKRFSSATIRNGTS